MVILIGQAIEYVYLGLCFTNVLNILLSYKSEILSNKLNSYLNKKNTRIILLHHVYGMSVIIVLPSS